MKKNYISRLKEYDAKTSLNDKQNMYRTKFINTCYNNADKENQDPNVAVKGKNALHGNKKMERNKTSESKKSNG